MADDTNGVQPTQEEHDAAMAEKYRQQLEAGRGAAVDAGDNPPERGGEKPERPAHIPEKFWDAEKGEVRVEDLAKSYAELEKKAAQKPAKGTGATNDGTQGGEGEKPNGEGEDPYVVGVKGFAALREQATQKLLAGEEFTDEMYAGFEKHGLSREDIGDWVAGQEARGTLARMEVFALEEVGGEDNYKAMVEWARANFDPAEVQVYDRDIHSFDKAVRLAAARGLAARYTQANGRNGRSVTAGATKRGADGFASGAEMRAAMKDKRYAKDPAYREEVARKVAAARAAGVDLMV